MKPVTVLLVLSSFISSSLNGQVETGENISGTIVSTRGEGISYATVTLYNKKDSTLVKGALTDSIGGFELLNIPEGHYDLNLSSVNIPETKIREIELKGEEKKLALGTISVSVKAINLTEVVVRSKKRLLDRRADRLIANIEGSVLAEGNNAIEVLNYLPGVYASESGSVKVNQKGDVLVLIDGRGTRQNQQQTQRLLGNMDAGNIDKIEVYTNPPSRFDAQGSAVINIITKKNKMFSDVRASYGHSFYQMKGEVGDAYGLSGSTNLNYNFGRIRTYANLSSADNFNVSFLEEKSKYPDINYLSEGQTKFTTTDRFFSYVLGSNWEIKPGHDLVVEAKGMTSIGGEVPSNTTKEIQFHPAEIEKLDSTLKYNQRDNRNYKNNDIAIAYLRSFDQSEKYWNVQFNYSKNNNTSNNTFDNRYQNNQHIRQQRVESDRDFELRSFVASTDAKLDLPSKTFIEFGGKHTQLLYDEDNFLFSQFDRFNYKEGVSGAYFDLNGSLKKLEWKIGLRAENTHWKIKSETFEQANRKNNYFDLFPSLFLQYALKENKKLGVSLSRRIARPTLGEFNPFVSFQGPLSFQQGDSETLLPRYYNTFEVNYLFGVFYASVSFARTKNQRVFFPISQDTLVTTYQPTSTDHEDNLYGSLSFPFKLRSWWSTHSEVAFYYTNTTLIGSGSKAGLGFNFRTNHTINITDNWKLTAFFTYQAPNHSGYSRVSAIYFANLALQWRSPKKNLRLIFRINDVFGSKKWLSEFNFDLIRSRAEVTSSKRSVRLGLSYRFRMGNAFQKKNLDSSIEFEKMRAK